MMIQIGMPCDPDNLCQGIGWVLALIVLLLVIGLARIIFNEVRGANKKRLGNTTKNPASRRDSNRQRRK